MSDICRCLGSDGTAEHTLSMQTTCRPSVIVIRYDGVVRGPPMPSELIKAPANGFTEDSNWNNRSRPWRSRWIGRVSIQARDAPIQVIPVIVGLQFLIRNRPIIGDPVQCPRSEVRRVHAREMSGPVVGTPAHRIEHQHGWRGCASFCYWIILPALANVGAEVKCAPAGLSFPVRKGGGIIRRFNPAPLFQAHHFCAKIGQTLCNNSACGPRANYKDVNFVIRHCYASL